MSHDHTASADARKYLRLHLCAGIGPIRFGNLLRELGDVDAVLGASVGRLASVEGIGAKTAESVARSRDAADVDGELQRAAERGVRILCLADSDYPTLLQRIPDPPTCLYVRGTLEQTDALALGVVGSRACTRYGAEQSERFAALLASAGLTVVSGMARGIDDAAHHGALAGGGRTIAVMGCGLCHLYPPQSTQLAARIVERGAIVSELPMSVAPDAKNFPPRNRIIVGLSLGVLVVEAARRSGAMITARLASEYNREVFAIPGPIDRPTSEGCNELIQAGAAKLAMNLPDILEELGEAGRLLAADSTGGESRSAPANVVLNPTEQGVLEAMGMDPVSIDLLCEGCGLPPARVAATLTTLQLKGVVRRVAGDLYESMRRA